MSSSRKTTGTIVSLYAGVGRVRGFSSASIHELVGDESGSVCGMVIGLDGSDVEVLFFDNSIHERTKLVLLHRTVVIPRHTDYAGFVGIGKQIVWENTSDDDSEVFSIFQSAPEIYKRKPVDTPLLTGIKVLDAVLPIGRGQRELIIGDRKLGKSTLAIDVILNQIHGDPPVHCIYVVVGQSERYIQDLVRVLTEYGALEYTTIIATSSHDPLAIQYIAPFVGCAIGELYRDAGKHALVIYDDLSKHANVYRDISLLLNRTPGREAYPGDIFSLHAGLLERAAALSDINGGGTLTALPIAETQESDITSYIPTNLISITDGQIYFDRALFQSGSFPPVNVWLSVSRIGSRVQPASMQRVSAGIRLALSQQRELQKLSQLESGLSSHVQPLIHRGNLLLEFLKQTKESYVSWKEQTILLYGIQEGLFDHIEPSTWASFEELAIIFFKANGKKILERIADTVFDSRLEKDVAGLVNTFIADFVDTI